MPPKKDIKTKPKMKVVPKKKTEKKEVKKVEKAPPKKKIKFKVVPSLKKEADEIGKKIKSLNPSSIFFSNELGKLMPQYYKVMAKATATNNNPKVREDLEKILGYAIAVNYGEIVASNIAQPSDFREKERNERIVERTAQFNKNKIFS